MKICFQLALLVGVLASFCCSIGYADNWPTWRGPQQTGVSSDAELPLEWSKTEHVRWRVDLPGPGNSSPIVWKDRVFVSQSLAAEKRRTLMCFDRSNGKLLWQSGVNYAEQESTHPTNPHCAGTPATDGERIYVCFGSPGVYAYDFAGNEVWHADLGKLSHIFGTAVSVTLHGDLCILNFGPGKGARLIALDKQTGDKRWEVLPPTPDAADAAVPSGGGGGRGGFGPGRMLAAAIFSAADADDDLNLTKDEITALAAKWFTKLDPTQSGKVTQEQFTEHLQDALPANGGSRRGPGGGRGGANPPGGEDRPRGGVGPGRQIGPALFEVFDVDKSSDVTQAEIEQTFAKWHDQWAAQDKTLSEEQLRDGLSTVLPQPNVGPGGGPAGTARGRPGGAGGAGGRPSGLSGFGGSWCTPIVVNAGGHAELIVAFPGRVVAYEPETGKQLWTSKGLGERVYATPVYDGTTVVVMSGNLEGGIGVAVNAGANGEVTESQRLWRLDRTENLMGSGVIHDGHLYVVGQDGIAACLNLKTGERVWRKRLRASGANGGVWSSMLLSGDKIYVPNQSGDVFVLAASPTYKLLATNSMGEATNASLAASDGELIMRTDAALWCIGGKP